MLQSTITPTVEVNPDLLVECDCFVRFVKGGKLVLMGSREQVAKAKKLLIAGDVPDEEPESDDEELEDGDE